MTNYILCSFAKKLQKSKIKRATLAALIKLCYDFLLPLKHGDRCWAFVSPKLDQEVKTLLAGVVFNVNRAFSLSLQDFLESKLALFAIGDWYVVEFCMKCAVEGVSGNILPHVRVFAQSLCVALLPVTFLVQKMLVVEVALRACADFSRTLTLALLHFFTSFHS